MAFYKVSGKSLEDVADAIRTKGETSSPLLFPDGFVEAIGNISGGGGSSRVAIGTFEGETTGGAIDVSIPYTGNGFPIAGIIYPSAGSYKSGDAARTLVQKSAILIYAFAKNDNSSTPTYGENADANQAAILTIYKSDVSDPTATTSARTLQGRFYQNGAPSASAAGVVKLKSNTTMSVYIAGDSYGFPKDIEYTYYIVYSE